MEKFQRSERTMFPREHTPPLRGKQFAAAKAQEALRKQWDPGYLTRDEAAAIPQAAVAANPDLRGRIERSRPDWPESNAVASIALGATETGEGETVQSRPVLVEAITGGGRITE